MSVNLFKSLILAAVGVAIQLTLFFLKRGKSKRLEELEKEEERERQRLLEEEWAAANQAQDQSAELNLLRDLEDAELVETAGFGEFSKAIDYDGELNSMTFNRVKGSRAFQSRLDVIDDEDLSWLGAPNQSTLDGSKI